MPEQGKHVLVTGGAGYIGSHTAKALAAAGFIPVTYDNLTFGHRWAVQWGPMVEGDVRDRAKLIDTLRRYEIAAVLHFAALAYVGESMRKPELYYNNNVTGGLTLLESMLETGVRHIVFSSSCATYGTPQVVPIAEDTPQLPVNPYGETKLAIERALRWLGAAHPLSWAALRYFNAAGADAAGDVGELHAPESHLIPLVLEAVLSGQPVEVYGGDYATRDGTCVRDYIHVTDLAEAHVRALDYLLRGGASIALNLGTGEGSTVHEVIETARVVTGQKVPFRVASRRPGDPAALVADAGRAGKILGWRPGHSSLKNIVKTAWDWRCAHLQKYLPESL